MKNNIKEIDNNIKRLNDKTLKFKKDGIKTVSKQKWWRF